MHQMFSSTGLDQQPVQCPQCNWKGLATQTEQLDLFLTDATEIYCPECTGYIGFINQGGEEGM